MKNILLLGATGTAGSALTKKLLTDTDCHLTLFSRHAKDKYADTDRIAAVNGDAENLEELKVMIPGHDVLYCAVSIPERVDAEEVQNHAGDQKKLIDTCITSDIQNHIVVGFALSAILIARKAHHHFVQPQNVALPEVDNFIGAFDFTRAIENARNTSKKEQRTA